MEGILFTTEMSIVPMPDKSFVHGIASGSGTYLVHYSPTGALLDYKMVIPKDTVIL
jgi:hypothetical protein